MSSEVVDQVVETGGGGEHRRGRPVLGAFAGFFSGLFLAIVLLGAGIVPLNSLVVTLLPVVLLGFGIVWGRWAPLGRKRAEPGAGT
jgi:hypothetical protein